MRDWLVWNWTWSVSSGLNFEFSPSEGLGRSFLQPHHVQFAGITHFFSRRRRLFFLLRIIVGLWRSLVAGCVCRTTLVFPLISKHGMLTQLEVGLMTVLLSYARISGEIAGRIEFFSPLNWESSALKGPLTFVFNLHALGPTPTASYFIGWLHFSWSKFIRKTNRFENYLPN